MPLKQTRMLPIFCHNNKHTFKLCTCVWCPWEILPFVSWNWAGEFGLWDWGRYDKEVSSWPCFTACKCLGYQWSLWQNMSILDYCSPSCCFQFLVSSYVVYIGSRGLRVHSWFDPNFYFGCAPWQIATALFANSPFTEGKPNGYLSFRRWDLVVLLCSMQPWILSCVNP